MHMTSREELAGIIRNGGGVVSALLRRIKKWFNWRVAHCTFCGATSDRMPIASAERIAKNHRRGTGHVNVRVERKWRV